MTPMTRRGHPRLFRWLAGTLLVPLACAWVPTSAFALRAAGLEENADRERMVQLLDQGGLTPIIRVAGQDVSAPVRRLLRYKVYEPSELTDRLGDLQAAMTAGLPTFEALSSSRQLAVYRLAGLLGFANRLEKLGVDPNRFSYDSFHIITHSEDIHPLPTRGVEMPVGQTWSTVRTEHYRRILEIPQAVFPTEGASVLSTFGEDGGPLLQIAPLMRNSRLVLLDANSANIRRAMDRFDAQRDSNTYEITLSDVRAGFGGIPSPNDAFDVVLMLGHAEHGMSRDDLLRALTEIVRVLKPSTGRLFVETNNADRYGWALQRLVQQHRAWSVAMYPLAETIFLLVKQPTAGMEEREAKTIAEDAELVPGDIIELPGVGRVVIAARYRDSQGTKVDYQHLDAQGLLQPIQSGGVLLELAPLVGKIYWPVPVMRYPSAAPLPTTWWPGEVWEGKAIPDAVIIMDPARWYYTTQDAYWILPSEINARVQPLPADHSTVPPYSIVAYRSRLERQKPAGFTDHVAVLDLDESSPVVLKGLVQEVLRQWGILVTRIVEIRHLQDGRLAIFV